MNMSRLERSFVFALLFAFFVLFMVVSFISPGYYGGADNINHYFISRYSFRDPDLFFDGWGRPLYTILSSPFAQFGFNGIRVFNAIVATGTLLVSYLTAKRLELSPRFLVIFFTAFTPVYFIMIPTALTEILGGFILLLAVYLFFREKYAWSAIVISFIYFARNEAIIFYPLFLVAYILRKQYKAIPFLFTGILLFTLVGGFYFRDPLWLIHHFLYPIHHKIYKETGSLLHFYYQRDLIFGKPLVYLLSLGIIVMFLQLFSKERERRKRSFFEILLILTPLAGYFIMHSVFYWKALGGSIGLIRVMAAVMPLSALVCMKGFDFINRFLVRVRWLNYAVPVAVTFWVASAALRAYPVPIRLTSEEKCIRDAAIWFRNSEFSGNLVFYTDLNFPFFLGVNPNDHSKSMNLFYERTLDTLPDSCLVVWDSHFGPNENEIPRDALMQNTQYKLLQVFKPLREEKTLGGHSYEVLAFLKLPPSDSADNSAIMEWLMLKEEASYKLIKSFQNTFEMPGPEVNKRKLDTQFSHSGRKSFKMDPESEFGPAFIARCRDITPEKEGIKVRVSLYVYPLKPFENIAPWIVVSLENRNGAYDYATLSFHDLDMKINQWNKAEMEARLAPVRSGNDRVKVYVYNPDKLTFYIDDQLVEFLVAKTGNR